MNPSAAGRQQQYEDVLKRRALQWLRQREHSPVELEAKLKRLACQLSRRGDAPTLHDKERGLLVDARGLSSSWSEAEAEAEADQGAGDAAGALGAVAPLIQWLQAEGLLSLQRFIDSRVIARQSRFGNQRILLELRQHGAQPDAHTDEELKRSEYLRARALYDRRYPAPALDATERARRARFMTGRGFGRDVIQRLLRGAD